MRYTTWSEKVTFYLEDTEVGTPFTIEDNTYYLIYSVKCWGKMRGVDQEEPLWWDIPRTPWKKVGESELSTVEVQRIDIDFCAAYKDGDDVKERIKRGEEPDVLLAFKGSVADELFHTLRRDWETIEEYLDELGKKCMWKMWGEGYDLDDEPIFTEKGEYLNT